MLKIKNLLRGISTSLNIPKKVYTNGLVVISSCMVIALLVIGTNGFKGAGKNVFAIWEDTNQSELVVEENEFMEDVENVVLELDQIESSSITTQNEEKDNTEQTEELIEKNAMKEEKSNKDINLHTFNQVEYQESNLIKTDVNDYEALIRIVEAEATDEDIIGKIMVANVVLNRVKDSGFPNDIYSVIHQKLNGRAQFSPIDDGRYYSISVTSSTKKAVERALKGEDHSNGALYFVARALASEKALNWFDNSLTKVAHHGVHEFFK